MHIKFLTKKNMDMKNTSLKTAGVLAGRKNPTSVLFSRGKVSSAFFTEDSNLYITPREQMLLRQGVRLDRGEKKWDSLSARVVREFVRVQPEQSNLLLEALEKRYALFNDSVAAASRSFVGHFSLVRLWNLSIVGSILFGMVLMTFVYRYLGQGASAGQISPVVAAQARQEVPADDIPQAGTSADDAQAFTRQVLEIERAKNRQELEEEIYKMVKGSPMEKMVPYIAEKDRTVAAFIVGIAKKESGWGKRVPVLDGKDCYNYWGYRGIRERMGTDGHTCFDSPQDAVDTVAKRIATLVKKEGRDTPAKMVLWKCGSDCEATGGQAAADKWISDITPYFNKLND